MTSTPERIDIYCIRMEDVFLPGDARPATPDPEKPKVKPKYKRSRAVGGATFQDWLNRPRPVPRHDGPFRRDTDNQYHARP